MTGGEGITLEPQSNIQPCSQGALEGETILPKREPTSKPTTLKSLLLNRVRILIY